jgi:hypothetical protein
MNPPASMLGRIFMLGIALGAVGTRVLNAQPPPVRFAELLRADLAGLPDKQVDRRHRGDRGRGQAGSTLSSRG